MKWFTSDLHLGHRNIAGNKVSNWNSGYRTFDSVEQMDSELINRINEYVSYDDELWHLGDFCMGGDIRKYFERITCQNIYTLKGNHDRPRNLRRVPFKGVFDTAQIFNKEINQIIFMSHYAHRVWNKSHRGAIHLYGHSHGSISDDWGKSMDVGVDNIYKLFGEYRPISEEEIIKIMKDRPIAEVDHHVNS